jgi:urease accessory protein
MRKAEPAQLETLPTDATHEARFPAELLVWLSPTFPVGGFAYSQGIETAVEKRWVSDQATLATWLSALAAHGALHNDLIVISLVMRANDDSQIADLAELSAALQPSAERAAEARDQGGNFRQAYVAGWAEIEGTQAEWPDLGGAMTLPVAVGLAARAHRMDLLPVLESYAIAQVNNLVSAAIRLSVLGQFAGQKVIAELLPALRAEAQRAAVAEIDDLGTASFGADLASMLHETQTTRLFRS